MFRIHARTAFDHLPQCKLRWLSCTLIMATLLQSASAEQLPQSAADCSLPRGEPHAVLDVSSTGTLSLDDGREVQLAGMILPPPQTLSGTSITWEPLRSARDAVSALTGPKGAEIAISANSKPDRYGRGFADVYVDQAGERIWVQRALVEHGHAIVLARQDGQHACVMKLLEAETKARKEKRGLWAHAAYRVHDANAARDFSRLRSQFAIVEGKVVNVSERSSRMFINFGDNWKTDFTIAVPKAVLAKDPDIGTRLSSLAGHTVRVRGWIERRYGPSIEITSADDIEDLGTNAPIAADPP